MQMWCAVALNALFLTGCGGAADSIKPAKAEDTGVLAANNATKSASAAPKPSATPADTSAADNAAIRAVIDAGYGGYNRSGGAAFSESPDFKKAIKRASGEEGLLAADIYCGCQDHGKVRWKIDSLKVEGDSARANISLDFFSQGDWVKSWIKFARVGGKWLVDDVEYDGGSMKAQIKANPPGSFGM